MTESTIIENKVLIGNIVDMMSNLIKIDRKNVLVDTYLLIDENTEMSIDLIAESVYGTNEAIDILCKFNGISNPLSIKSGDTIAIPNLNSLFQNMRKINVQSMKLPKQKSSAIKTTLTKTSTSSPSKKTTKQKNFTKSGDGTLIF